MFGLTLVSKKYLEELERESGYWQNFCRTQYWYSGWFDLRFLFKTIKERNGDIGHLESRREYALMRGTDDYGVPIRRDE